MTDEPRVLPAEVHLDDRGALTCCNEFDLGPAGVRRVYFVRNLTQSFVRAWHGHLKAHTWLWPTDGVWKMAAARILRGGQENPTIETVVPVCAFILSQTSILYVPPGWFHGHQNLTHEGCLAVFSSATMKEVKADDLRQPWDQIPGAWEQRPR